MILLILNWISANKKHIKKTECVTAHYLRLFHFFFYIFLQIQFKLL